MFWESLGFIDPAVRGLETASKRFATNDWNCVLSQVYISLCYRHVASIWLHILRISMDYVGLLLEYGVQYLQTWYTYKS